MLFAKKILSSSLLSKITNAPIDNNFTNRNQIFDYKIDYKYCVKNLLRFVNSNIAGGRIDKRLNNLQGILFFGLLKIQIIFKVKITKGSLYLARFFIC